MAISFDPKKGSEKFSGFLKKTAEVGKSAAEGVQKGATALSEKVKDANYQDRLRKYNPLFPAEYTAADFVLPPLISIVDEAVRRGIDVCEGAVGWSSIEAETKVLHLYNTATALKNITFYPSALCGAAYCVDNFDPNRYINVDYVFDKSHEERLAELEEIAFALGATSYTIGITDSRQEANSSDRNIALKGIVPNIGKLSVKAESAQNSATGKTRTGTISSVLEGHNNPQPPKLKWFAEHENIKKLIDKRCSEPDAIKSRSLKISGSSFATMTHKVAAAIDGLRGISGSFSMQSQTSFEHNSELVFSIEF